MQTISFPIYVAETDSGEHIAGPATDCQRMMIAAETWNGFSDVSDARVIWVGTLTAEEARKLRTDAP